MVKSDSHLSASPASRPGPSQRLVVLGASNIARGLASLVGVAQQELSADLDFLSASGHGRSYGLATRIPFRGLGSIVESGLWEGLALRPRLPTTALITDVGNDILYGQDAEQISDWVAVCLERLAEFAPRLVLTELPLEVFRHVSPAKFLFFRTLMFPKSRLQLDRALATAEELNLRIQDLAARFGARCVRPASRWYGFDPIHIRYTAYEAAWRTMLAGDGSSEASLAPTPIPWSPARWCTLKLLPPHERTICGWVQRRAQPALTLPDGLRVSLY